MKYWAIIGIAVLGLSPLGAAAAAEHGMAFIKAKDLLQAMQRDSDLFVFDVRTAGEYDQGHIEGALSLPLNDISQPRLNSIDGMTRDSAIVTYCGCPHHLSGLAAQQLARMKYTNVRVLEEGFWYWKENRYPILPAMSEFEVTELSVSGRLVAENKPVDNIDIFIRHAESGQLEAAKTDVDGNYEMHLHLYDYQPDDKFEFYVADLKGEAVRDFIAGSHDETGVVVSY